jgi:hypothetical protein
MACAGILRGTRRGSESESAQAACGALEPTAASLAGRRRGKPGARKTAGAALARAAQCCAARGIRGKVPYASAITVT